MMKSKTQCSLFPVFAVLFIDNLGFAMVFATFGELFSSPDYGLVKDGMSLTLRNLMLACSLAVFPIAQLFGSPILGDIADQFGRKKAFYITIGGGVLGYVLSGICISSGSFTLLIISRIITGFFAGNLAICLAAIADLSQSETSRSKNFSIIVIVTGISWIVAMLVGGFSADSKISQLFAPSLPFYITAFFALLSLIIIAVWFKESHKTQKKFKIDIFEGIKNITQTFYIKKLKPLYLVYFLWILGWAVVFQWFNPYSIQHYDATDRQITWGMCLFGLTWMLGGYFINDYLAKRYHVRPILLVTILLTILGVVAMWMAPNFLLFTLIMSLTSIPAAISWPNILNIISMNANENIQGKIMGISQSAQAIGFIFATIIGAIFGAGQANYLYLVAAIPIVVSVTILFFNGHSEGKKSHQ